MPVAAGDPWDSAARSRRELIADQARGQVASRIPPRGAARCRASLRRCSGGRAKAMVIAAATGVPNLDEILGGGLPARSLSLILGVPGGGKTILAAQVAVHHARQGRRALIFTALSESHEQLLAGLAEF